MNKEQFQVGDIVVIRSGGPKMTVENLSEIAESMHCIWFGGDVLYRANFYPQELVRVKYED